MCEFEVLADDCMCAAEKVKEDCECMQAISKAKEIAIDIYGNTEFYDASNVAAYIQELAPADADIMFRVVSEQTQVKKTKMVINIR